jgi:hypothetical protein
MQPAMLHRLAQLQLIAITSTAGTTHNIACSGGSANNYTFTTTATATATVTKATLNCYP